MSKFLISPAFIFGIFIVIFVLHILALSFGWYLSIRNFDNLHHFLGGVWAAAVFFYFLNRKPGIVDVKKSFLAALALGMSFAVFAGLLWEIFEFTFDYFFAPLGFPRAQLGLNDTMGDLFFDLLGGLVFTAAYFKSLKR